MKLTDIIIPAALAALPLTAVAEYHEPIDVTRVMWDLNSRKCIFDAGNYGRIIPLQDGRLMAVAETYGTYSGITVAYSTDNGNVWTNKETVAGNGNGVPVAVPDLIQLADGTLIVGYNPRPSAPYSEDRHFGIRCVRSTDNGATWSEPIYIYDAGHQGSEGCWEPSFLEMPDGELHCYFANEHPYTGNNNDQEISMCRSFDKGLTWTDPVRICYRQGSRDGMPSAIITDAGEIVVIIEDNGHWGRGGFRATTVRCTLEQNWEDFWVDAASDNRDMIFLFDDCKNAVSAAPYIRRLPSGETLCSWQGNWNDRAGWPEDRYDVYVGVGDKDGRNVAQISQPFKVSSSEHSLWNSVAVGFDNTVFVVSSIGGSNGIYTLTGKAITGFEANYGTPVINGTSTKENWTAKNASQVFMGQYFRNRSTHDFLYDEDYLYFTSYVSDRTIVKDTDVNDGVQLSLDMGNICDTAPQEGIYTFFLDIDGTVEYACGKDGEFHAAECEGIDYKVVAGKSYYMLEVAIPWSALGVDKAPVGRDMRVNVEVRNIGTDGGYSFEPIPEAKSASSYTWPQFHLNESETGGVDAVEADGIAGIADAPVEYYNLLGMKVANPGGGLFVRRQGRNAEKVLLP